MFFDKILNTTKKQIAVLIDPDKQSDEETIKIAKIAEEANVDFFLVGGSLMSEKPGNTIKLIKKNTKKPVYIFPGSVFQLSDEADGIFLLSLISGRNADFLIGNQVIAAPFLKKSKLEIIPVGYIIVETGKMTSVEYMSNTKPIPYDKKDIASATAIAGELIGQKLIYLEAGSGALKTVSEEMIMSVKENIEIPLIVGGGIRNEENLRKVCSAGADIVVVGTAFEEDKSLIEKFCKIVHSF
jgi:putative glycerol-1-phosphate prenyltransferase